MKTRPRTKFVHATGERRCPKCQGKLNNQVTRCKRCNAPQVKPKKRLKKKLTHRVKVAAKKARASRG